MAKFKLFIATFVLSGTIFVRFTMNLLRITTGLSELIDSSIENDTYVAPLYDATLFLISDSAPAIAQLLSMIFGLIRMEQGS